MNDWYEANPPNCVGDAMFDAANILTNGGRFVYALNELGRSIVLDFSEPDGNGNNTGQVAVYLQDNVGGAAWRVVAAGKTVVRPLPSTKYLTMIPQAGSTGIFRIQLTRDTQGVGNY